MFFLSSLPQPKSQDLESIREFNEKKMNETLLQKNEPETQHSVDGNKESQSIASRQKKPQRALARKLFLLIGAVSLIVMAVYGLVTRSATTE